MMNRTSETAASTAAANPLENDFSGGGGQLGSIERWKAAQPFQPWRQAPPQGGGKGKDKGKGKGGKQRETCH